MWPFLIPPPLGQPHSVFGGSCLLQQAQRVAGHTLLPHTCRGREWIVISVSPSLAGENVDQLQSVRKATNGCSPSLTQVADVHRVVNHSLPGLDDLSQVLSGTKQTLYQNKRKQTNKQTNKHETRYIVIWFFSHYILQWYTYTYTARFSPVQYLKKKKKMHITLSVVSPLEITHFQMNKLPLSLCQTPTLSTFKSNFKTNICFTSVALSPIQFSFVHICEWTVGIIYCLCT